MINIGLIPLLNNSDFETWFSEYGLVEDTFFNILFYIAGEIIFTLIDMFQLFQYVRRFYERHIRGEKCTLTQQEANTLWENSPVMLFKRYSMILILLLLALFFGPIFPGISILCFLGLVLMSWTVRYVLLRRSSFKLQVGWELGYMMANSMPFAIFLYAILNMLFYRNI